MIEEGKDLPGTLNAPKDEKKPTTFIDSNNTNPLGTFTPPRWRAPQGQVHTNPVSKPVAKAIDDAKDPIQQSINAVAGNQSPTGSATAGRNAVTTLDISETEDQQQVRTGFVAPIAIITNVVNAALAPFLNPTPGQPAPQNPILWAVLGWDSVGELYTTTDTSRLGDPFIKGVAASGGHFYVTNPSDNTVVDTANPTNPMAVGGKPVSIAYDEANDRVYVTVSRPNATDPDAYDLVVVNATSGDEVGVVYTALPSQAGGGEQTTLESDMAVSPNGDHIYVTSIANSTVTVMNAQTGAVEHTITVPKDIVGRGAPYRIAFSPEGDHAYVVDEQGKVSQISFADTAENAVTV